ncbi:MAG: TIR domain-containing protein, partial [Chloroflexi bacterium]|nr:TIR domain-containing protein [Chloroflexota bacterium]
MVALTGLLTAGEANAQMTDNHTAKDFFISYNKADRAWAEWIAWQLQSEGYSVVLQAWHFRPGNNFVLQMDAAVKNAKRTLAVLSPNYLDLAAVFSQAEWAATLVQDATGQEGRLLPIRVRECTPKGLLAAITYIDFVDLDASTARNALLTGVRQSGALPSREPSYPGNVLATIPEPTSFPGKWPEVWTVPYNPNPFFTGREMLLTCLHEQLVTTKPTALTQPQTKAISGLGGIGKTQTALEYAHRYGHEYRYVLWVSAASTETLLSEMMKLAALLQVPGQDTQDQQKTIEALKSWLATQRDWLLILDNADDLALASEYLPQGARTNGHVLLTTRDAMGGAFAHVIEVNKMDKEEGTLLLLRRARILDSGAPLEQANQKDHADAEAIVVALDGLPLALDQAGAYIEEMRVSLSNYLTLYQARRKDLMERRGRLSPGHPGTVATTWSLSFSQVERANRAAAELLRLCAFLAPDAIPEEIITEGADNLGTVLGQVACDPLKLNEAIEVVRRYSLLRRNRETNTLSMHRLVQAVLKDGMNARTQKVWAERVVYAVNAAFPAVDIATWSQAQPYLPHAEICLALIEQYQFTFPEAATLLHNWGLYFYYTVQYKQAEPLYLRALHISEQALGPLHPSTASTLHELARLYQDQGHYPQAEPLYLRALAIKEQALG